MADVRRWASRLVIALGVLLVGRAVYGAVPREVELSFLPEAAARLRSLRYTVNQGDEEILGGELRWSAGSPLRVQRQVELPPGAYELVAEASWTASEGATEATLSRRVRFESPAQGPVLMSLRLSDVAAVPLSPSWLAMARALTPAPGALDR